MTFIIIALSVIINIPKIIIAFLIDLFFYIKDKQYKNFNKFGIHIYVSAAGAIFGSGKSSIAVVDAYKLCKRYKNITVLTNMDLFHFPKWTKILKLKTIDDIINAPHNTIIIVDEIGSLFNSRDFSNKSPEALSKQLFRHLTQCRKRHKVLFGTSQRYLFVDKQIRDVTSTVTTNEMFFKHPFSRWIISKKYLAYEYELAFSNPLYPIKSYGARLTYQSNKYRNLYDTEELIEGLIKAEYYPENDIPFFRTLNILDNSTAKKVKKSANIIR